MSNIYTVFRSLNELNSLTQNSSRYTHRWAFENALTREKNYPQIRVFFFDFDSNHYHIFAIIYYNAINFLG